MAITAILVCLPFITCKSHREMKTINDGWMFFKGDATKASDYLYDEKGWNTVIIPHTWNSDAYTNKAYYKGIGWYRKKLLLSEDWKDKQIFLKFEAANKAASIFINGQLVGEHQGGYTAFTIDITPYCSFSSPNVIAVKVDNAREDIPPISGDFTFFGGIYRDVWLIAVPKQHFDLLNYGSDGIFIQTPQVSAKQASLIINGSIKNDSPQKTQLEVKHIIYTPSGQIAQTLHQEISLKAHEQTSFSTKAKPVLNPHLWSPESPTLYRIETILIHSKTKKILDRLNNYTGFRWSYFDEEKGFFLNGKSYKLRGICRHQDQKPIGVAMSDEMHRRDILMMKEMGANFIRISHYPQDPSILEQCDKLGMMVWEEIPIIDIVPNSIAYANTCEQNLREMIRQHYNHPSIITWGFMNEILLVTQREYKNKEELKPVIKRTIRLAKQLERILKEEDSFRSSIMAFHASNMYNEIGLSDVTDVVGWNLYSGWYGGKLSDFEKFLDEQHTKYPNRPIIVSEYGAGSDKRLHSFTPRHFDFSIEYQQQYLEHYLPVIEKRPFVSGGTHWNFIDFSSALRDESMPRINNKGLVYSDRTPKDVFFYFQAVFRKDIPVIHIASRDWIYRSGIQSDNNPVVQPIKIYTNLPEVELFVDGYSLGKKKNENYSIIFDVPFSAGTHFLRVVGINKKNNKLIEDGINITFTPIPKKLNAENIDGLELAVNVGSNCFFISNESNLTWLPDRRYESGGWGYIDENSKSEEISIQNQIINTYDNPLYQTLRSNLEGYRFDVPAGEYEVELLFADVFKESNNIPYQLNEIKHQVTHQNMFNIVINHHLVDKELSPSKNSGYFQALKKRYIIKVENEGLGIHIEQLSGKTFLNGIKIRKLY